MPNLQFIRDDKGKPQFVVIPISEYERLLGQDIINDDDITIPNDVVQLMVKHDISLLAAWRMYRGLSQYEVAEKIGVNQSSVSQLEKPDSKPQRKTKEKLAAIYDCKPEQLIL